MSAAENVTTVRVGSKTVACIRDKVLDVRRHSDGFLHTPEAIALSVQTIEQARQAGVTTIQVLNMDTGSTFAISLSDFMRYAWQDERGGYEKQYLVALDRFEKHYADRSDKRSLKALDKIRRPSKQQQMSFRGWG